ncbi:hypothetical protein V8C86DRAFT_2707035 [Haematococcus lacustris]
MTRCCWGACAVLCAWPQRRCWPSCPQPRHCTSARSGSSTTLTAGCSGQGCAPAGAPGLFRAAVRVLPGRWAPAWTWWRGCAAATRGRPSCCAVPTSQSVWRWCSRACSWRCLSCTSPPSYCAPPSCTPCTAWPQARPERSTPGGAAAGAGGPSCMPCCCSPASSARRWWGCGRSSPLRGPLRGWGRGEAPPPCSQLARPGGETLSEACMPPAPPHPDCLRMDAPCSAITFIMGGELASWWGAVGAWQSCTLRGRAVLYHIQHGRGAVAACQGCQRTGDSLVKEVAHVLPPQQVCPQGC